MRERGVTPPFADAMIRALTQGADHFTSVGLAVSGGSDSMALLRLAADVGVRLGLRLEAATIDHALRPEAADEARFVGQVCADLGVPHQIFRWDDHPGQGNVMAMGSAARYGYLARWGQARGLDVILVAHTQDDQAETFMMGLGRGAGLDGLTGMRSSWTHNGMRFLRPLLDAKRQELRDYLGQIGQVWVDDPSNVDPSYLRARVRAALPSLADLGITADSLGQTIRALGAAQSALQRMTAHLYDQIGQELAGALILDASAFAQADPELRRRLLIEMIRWISSSRHAPRGPSIAALDQQLAQGAGATLAGCQFRFSGRHLRVYREERAVQGPVSLGLKANGSSILWDGRWQISYDGGQAHEGTVEIRALGEAGYKILQRHADFATVQKNRMLKRDALLVSPSVWDGDNLVYAPLGAYLAKHWCLEMPTSFQKFMITH